MIPADTANRSQANADISLRPVAPTQEITDKIPGLSIGQRIMAQIQALLPNGTYRALVNQRNVTLALPFAAKSGDTLELQVTQSDGKLTLAVLAHRSPENATKESASATLSRAGQFIGELFSKSKGTDGETKALMLNGNRPISEAPPRGASDILPLLKEAITRSGMFYESHQAQWVAGRFTKTSLLQEPQGTLSTPAAFQKTAESNASTQSAIAQAKAPYPQQNASEARLDSPSTKNITTSQQKTGTEPGLTQTTGPLVATQIQSLVHQQLAALANQHFVWQGQIWPGQDMRLEIEEEAKHRQQDEEDSSNSWSTRLNLTFPHLGGIDARIALQGNEIALSIKLANDHSLSTVRANSDQLRQQFHDAGLSIASIGISTQSEIEE